MRARIHAQSRLACEKEQHQYGKEHHVPGQRGKNEKPYAMQKLVRFAAFVLAVISSATTIAAGWAAGHRGFSAKSWLFPFRFRWGVRKG
jgi:hypothetical protein